MDLKKFSDAEFDTFGTQIIGLIPELKNTLALDDANLDATAVILTDTHTVYTEYVAKRAEADAARHAYRKQRLLAEKEMQYFTRAVKADKNYTEAIGRELQLVGNPKPPIDEVKSKTILTCQLIGGKPYIRFRKGKATGIKLYSRRADEIDFTLLSLVHRAPYVDDRPNLIPNQPEQREYRAILFLNDKEIGIMSDTLSMLVMV